MCQITQNHQTTLYKVRPTLINPGLSVGQHGFLFWGSHSTQKALNLQSASPKLVVWGLVKGFLIILHHSIQAIRDQHISKHENTLISKENTLTQVDLDFTHLEYARVALFILGKV